MSLYDGKTLESDYRQLVKDNLTRLATDIESARNEKRMASGYFQVIDGTLRFIQTIQSEPIRRDGNRRRDGLIRSSNRSAQEFASNRAREYRLNREIGKYRPLPPKLRNS